MLLLCVFVGWTPSWQAWEQKLRRLWPPLALGLSSCPPCTYPGVGALRRCHQPSREKRGSLWWWLWPSWAETLPIEAGQTGLSPRSVDTCSWCIHSKCSEPALAELRFYSHPQCLSYLKPRKVQIIVKVVKSKGHLPKGRFFHILFGQHLCLEHWILPDLNRSIAFRHPHSVASGDIWRKRLSVSWKIKKT